MQSGPGGGRASGVALLQARIADLGQRCDFRERHAGTPANGRLVPTIVFPADRDSTAHPRNGDLIIALSAGARGLRRDVRHGQVPGGRTYPLTVYIDAADRAELAQWQVHGGCHAWSGGRAEGSYTDPRGLDASGEMLRFFLGHTLDIELS